MTREIVEPSAEGHLKDIFNNIKTDLIAVGGIIVFSSDHESLFSVETMGFFCKLQKFFFFKFLTNI